MSPRPMVRWPPALCYLAVLLTACPSSRRSPDGGNPSRLDASIEAGHDAAQSEDSGPFDGGEDAGTSGPPMICSGSCVTDEDCCYEVGVECGFWPNNRPCVDEVCGDPFCEIDEDCTAMFLFHPPGSYGCLRSESFAIPWCTLLCESDDDCSELARCLPTDDGRVTCLPTACTDDASCCRWLSLDGPPCGFSCGDDGRCQCEEDEACTLQGRAPDWATCIDGWCQCVDDEDCERYPYPVGLEPRCVPSLE